MPGIFYFERKKIMEYIEIKGKVNTAVCYAKVVED